MTTLSITQAEEILSEAGRMNPGIWEEHSKSAARTARSIAAHCKMDEEKAYVMGLLHDVGRREGVTAIRHIFDGYYYLRSLGQEEIGVICLTHSFPYKDPTIFFGEYDCTKEELEFLTEFLKRVEYDDYHMLIQLCDALALPQGPVLMEKRLIDVALRHGLPDCTLKKWQAYFELKKYFDQKAGSDIYDFLPGIRENTFS